MLQRYRQILQDGLHNTPNNEEQSLFLMILYLVADAYIMVRTPYPISLAFHMSIPVGIVSLKMWS